MVLIDEQEDTNYQTAFVPLISKPYSHNKITRQRSVTNHPQNAFTILFSDVSSGQAHPRVPTHPIQFHSWVPNAVRSAITRLHAGIEKEKDPGKAKKLLERLSADPRMEAVWQRLKSHPAYVRPASWAARYRELSSKATTLREKTYLKQMATATEAEPDPFARLKWSDQELAMQLFLWQVYRENS